VPDRVDDARIERAAVLVAQSHALHHAGAEIVDDHVRAGDQRAHGLHVLGALEIERDAALVAVEAAEHRVVVTGDRLEGAA
jgi:hypothetical protein